MANREFLAQQMNRAFQLFAQNLELSETEAMEIADLYEPWAAGKAYRAGKIIKHGVNAEGETQLFSVVQAHTSQADWLPDATPSLYKAIGFAEDGTPIWTQPLGGHDAYAKGDEVRHKDQVWVSDMDGNVWEPGVYGWSVVG